MCKKRKKKVECVIEEAVENRYENICVFNNIIDLIIILIVLQFLCSCLLDYEE